MLRSRFKHVRDGLGSTRRADIDKAIAHCILALPAWMESTAIYTYLSFDPEVDTRALIRRAWAEGKLVALPRCVPGTRTMRWYAVESFWGLERSRFGVDEPVPGTHREVDGIAFPAAIALVPGLAFDADGYRLGYGGGFYDAFLGRFAGLSIGLCRRATLSSTSLALEPHDRCVKMVATEHGVTCP